MAGAGVVGLIKALANIDSAVIKAAIDAWLDDHPEATTTVEDGAITYAKLASGLKDILNKKADEDGYYESMTVGDAEQLVATVGVNDKVPYLFRTSGGSADIGDREVDEVVGGSFAWNQKADSVSDASQTGHGTETWASTITKNNGTLVVETTRDHTEMGFNLIDNSALLVEGHKYFVGIDVKAADFTPTKLGFNLLSNWIGKGSYSANWVGFGKYESVIACTGNGTTGETQRLSVRLVGTVANGDSATFYGGTWIDLTQLFGSTIADYIYSIETSTPGTGVAWFRKLFPKPYYAYNPGSMESVETDLHKMTGFNQWDEQWEQGSINSSGVNTADTDKIRSKNYIPVLPETTYYFRMETNSAWVAFFYDADKNLLTNESKGRNNTFAVPAGAHFMRFRTGAEYGGTYKNDICINLHWDGERDGEYEPYVAHEYALSPVVLRGIPKLDSGNKLYYDGDTYEADGTVTRRYAEVDLGDLTWGTGFSGFWSSDLASTIKAIVGETAIASRVRCAIYSVPSVADVSSLDKIVFVNGAQSYLGYIIVKDSAYTDAATFKAAMSGVKLVYELATTTTESANPYQTPQIVDDWGTEEYRDALATAQSNPRDVAIPVGHDTTYRNNLRAKLEMAPESPSGDGDYILRQTSGQNEYVLLEKELPSLPTEDGTYTLKCTVSGSTKTLTWESDAE